MTLRTSTSRVAATVAAVSILGATLGFNAASAAPPKQWDIQTLKAVGGRNVTRRLAELARLRGAVAADTTLAPAERTLLNGEIQADVAGLTNLGAKIAAGTDKAKLSAEVVAVRVKYWVFSVESPKVTMLLTADDVGRGATRFDNLAGVMANLIAWAQSEGVDTTKATAMLGDMKAAVAAAHHEAVTVTAHVVALEPSGYPANRPVLVASQAALTAAQGHLRAALTDATRIVKDLV